ncbi:hypothetical protein ID0178_04270 [Helicobacter pylori]
MISNISITPIKNMLKSALNIHNFSFKSRSYYWCKWIRKINAYQYYSRH